MRMQLRPNEQLILIARQHGLVLLKPFLLGVICIGSLVSSSVYFSTQLGKVTPFILGSSILPLAWIGWRYLYHRTNLWAVTTQRVIDESGVISYFSKESPLDKIHNITLHQSIFGRFFNYGTVEIQTAAEMGETIYHWIAKPKELKEAITNYQEQDKRTARGGGPKKPNPDAGLLEVREDMRDCPHCAEPIKIKAKICRFCGRDV